MPTVVETVLNGLPERDPEDSNYNLRDEIPDVVTGAIPVEHSNCVLFSKNVGDEPLKCE